MSLSAICIQEAIANNFKVITPLAAIQLHRNLQLVFQQHNYPVPLAYAHLDIPKLITKKADLPAKIALIKRLYKLHPSLPCWVAFCHWRLLDYSDIYDKRHNTFQLALHFRRVVREVHVLNNFEIPVSTAQYILRNPHRLTKFFEHLFDDAALNKAAQDVRDLYRDLQARNYYLLYLQTCPTPSGSAGY